MDIKGISGKAKVVGTLVCIGGAMVLTLYKGMPLFDHSYSQAETAINVMDIHPTRKTERWTFGTIALTVGTLLWASWFPIQSYIGKRYPCKYSSTAILSLFGAIQAAILCLATNRNHSAWSFKGKIEIISVLYAVRITIPVL